MNAEQFEYVSPSSYNLIYLYEIPGSAAHAGLIKVGCTTLKTTQSHTDFPPNCKALDDAAHARIKQQTEAAGIKYNLLYTEIAVRWVDNGAGKYLSWFLDHDVHNVLEKSGYKHVKMDGTKAREWYRIDLETAKKAIKATKEGRVALNSGELSKPEAFVFREEQIKAIEMTLTRFKKHLDMLWDAKMRFGKTPTALEVVRRGKFRKTIIITHRPVVATSWRDDFKKIFPSNETPYEFVDKLSASGSSNAVNESRKKQLLNTYDKNGRHFIYFASIQDLRESHRLGGKYMKNDAVFDMEWDLVIVDEAHEGTQTDLGKKVSAALSTKNHTRVLSLSGTPFNIMSSYDDDAVFVWDYTMEQKTKTEWDEKHPGEKNPYATLPKMNILTFDLSQALGEYAEEELEGKAFNFTEFFRTWTGDAEIDGRKMPSDIKAGAFMHADDVRKFLDLISTRSDSSNYPFVTPQYCDFFRHTLWIVPGVAAAKALSAMLDQHPIFGSFGVANVAGAGDDYEEEHYDNALQLVREKIRKYPRTITLSCGKLTTGVTVPEWTGVMMIAGSVHTAASSYMQTIFRVQSPWVHDGRVKEECYVFDFAPDRTLTVLTEAAQLSRRVKKDDDEKGRAALREFINFCPVLAMEGGRAKPYDVAAMMRRLKHVFVMKAIRNGFDDPSIYNNEKLMKLGKLDLMKFSGLEGIVGKTKQTESVNSVDVNSQGLTEEEYQALKEEAEKRKKRKLTPEEEAALKKRREELKKARDARSILRAISIRMPLLIYGADVPVDEKISIKRFVEMVDDSSWQEFMPKGVTKKIFNNFVEYYDADVFEAAGIEIRKLAKSAEKLSPGKRVAQIARIFSYFKNPDKETVLTPWRVVNMHMSDTLGGWCFFSENGIKVDNPKLSGGDLEEPRFVEQKDVTKRALSAEAKVLEINSKSGLYPLYVAYSIYRSKCGEIAEEDIAPIAREKKWREVLRDNVFVICKTPMAASITRRTLAGYTSSLVNAVCWPGDIVEALKTNPKKFITKITQGKFWGKEEEKMEFDAVVGNPPYQQMTGGGAQGSDPVYNSFIDVAMMVCEKGTLIHPGRFLFRAGKTPKNWNEKILSDEHFKVVRYFPNSSDVFPSVDIKGGVAITYWDKSKVIGPIGFFVAHKQLKDILAKVKTGDFESFSDIVYSRTIYRLSEKLYQENLWAEGRQSKGHRMDMGSNVFSLLPEFFLDTSSSDSDAKIFGLINNRRTNKYIKRDYILPPDNFGSYKVIVPAANGSGELGEVLSTPVVGAPYVGHTETFLSIGKFKLASEANACLKYIKTKFARTMLGTLKTTQHNVRETWSNIPLQDFGKQSDIDWTKSIAEIDRQLYKKYGITKDEIAFIESMIKPME